MKFPYAIRDFYALITEGYLYLDRTDRIPVMEALGKEVLFLRPRRFGKSLWLSTLMNYYDVAKAADFDRLFGQLAIGQQPTPLHNQYLVMRWDFSEVRSHGAIAQIELALHQHLNQWIDSFIKDYRHLVPTLASDVVIEQTNGLTSFHSLVAAVRRSPYKLYLFIDEYDNFANEVMMAASGGNHSEQQRYRDLIAGEGMFKTLFKNLKSAGSGEGLDRLFMTGVSPIVMNDITSGANTTKEITWHPDLHDLCGFSQAEVRHLVEQVSASCNFPPAKTTEALEQLRLFYNGSRFVTRELGPAITAKVYNPTLTFYFLEELQRFCLYPENMLDQNLAPDYNKLVYISSHPAGATLLRDALNDATTVSMTSLNERFGMAELLQPDQQRDRLAVLLCYLGALTVGGKTAAAELVLEIPNLVMRKLYAERILELIFPAAAERDAGQDAARHLFTQGEIEPLCAFIEQTYLAVYDNRDYQHFNELTLKTLFMALLQHNNLYIMDSEPTLQRAYGDLIMLIRPEMRHYSVYDLLFEFKYVPLERVRHAKKKLTGQQLRELTRQKLLALDAVTTEVDQAKAQLGLYQQTLRQKYGTKLKLRTYAVVSVGFERLVWVEV